MQVDVGFRTLLEVVLNVNDEKSRELGRLSDGGTIFELASANVPVRQQAVVKVEVKGKGSLEVTRTATVA